MIPIPITPGSPLSSQKGAIRAPMSAGTAMSCAARINWLLARAGCGMIFNQTFYNATYLWTNGGCCYHHPSIDCKNIVVVALFSGCVKGTPGTFTFTPSGGSAITYRDAYETTDDWTAWIASAPLASWIEQKHTWSVSGDLYLQSLTIWEMPRSVLNESSDIVCKYRSGAWAGIELGRVVTDASDSGIADLLHNASHAREETRRHLQFRCPSTTGYGWNTSSDVWTQVGPTAGFKHRARQIYSTAEQTSRTYSAYATTWEAAADVDYQWRLESTETSTTADSDVLSNTTPDESQATSDLSISSTADDTIKVYLKTIKYNGSSTKCYLSGFYLVEGILS